MTMEESMRKLRIKNVNLRVFLAEFLGTFTLILFGDASVAQYKLFPDNLGTYLSVNWAWGIAVAMGVWVSGKTSGGHINPAVSVAMTVLGRLSPLKCLIYMGAQYLGAILASAVIYGVYYDALNNYELTVFNSTERVLDSAGIWATYPQAFIGWGTAFADQIVGTGMLVMCVMAITDDKNMKPPAGMVPFCVGLIVAVIGMTFGSNCGYAINPARDLGPRIFTAMAGWGSEPFTASDYYFWIPIVGPHVGAIIGAWVYLLCVGIHLPDDEDNESFYDGGDVNKLGPMGSNNDAVMNNGNNASGGHVNQAYL